MSIAIETSSLVKDFGPMRAMTSLQGTLDAAKDRSRSPIFA